MFVYKPSLTAFVASTIMRNVTYSRSGNDPEIGTTKIRLQRLCTPSCGLWEAEDILSAASPFCIIERINRTINLHDATPHVFRHNFTTLMNDSGSDIKTIQAIIGDADIRATANRYIHTQPETKQEEVKKVGHLLV